MIEKNPLIGGGIRSYRTHNNGCTTHPHNYYLEIISDLGIIGLTLILIFVFKLLFNFEKLLWSYSKIKVHHLFMLVPPILFILIEFFPLRTSGSFFSTNNASIIFIFFAILVS
jgi:O-antigen ligase